MCSPASGILTRHKCFTSKCTDSHAEIIKEFELVESVAGKICLLKWEITPPNGDMNKPPKEWNYKVDQENDALPAWYDAADCEKRAREHFENVWIKERLIVAGQTDVDVKAGFSVFVCSGGSVNAVCSGGIVNAVYSGGSVNAVHSGGRVNEVYGSVNAVYGSVIEVYSGGSVNLVYGSVNLVYGRVNAVCFGGRVIAVYGSVNAVYSGGSASFYTSFSVKLSGLLSVVIDRTGKKAKCYVGTEKERTIKVGGK